MAETSAIAIRTLLSHRDVDFMIDNWSTLVSCNRDPFTTVVHDDGSLTSTDIEKITSRIPSSRVLRKPDADEIMQQKLAAHPHARAFRAKQVWGIKLLDIVLAEPGHCYYADSDIRFLRPFRGLFTEDTVAGRCAFLRDEVWMAYSIRPWHLSRWFDRRGLRVVEGINTGLTIIDQSRFDLDFVDWFLAQPDWEVIPAWVEPTCWAALAVRANGHAIDPTQLTNLYPSAAVGPETVGVHLLSAYRKHFHSLLEQAPTLQMPCVDIRLQSLGVSGPWKFSCNQIGRKIRNEIDRRSTHV